MAFRRDGQKAHGWHRWRLKNKQALDACGLPEYIVADELSWLIFLDHGFHGNHWDREQFRLEDLSKEQLQAFYAFLDTELSENQKLSTMAFTLVKSMLNKAS
jgi:hypothetical protein